FAGGDRDNLNLGRYLRGVQHLREMAIQADYADPHGVRQHGALGGKQSRQPGAARLQNSPPGPVSHKELRKWEIQELRKEEPTTRRRRAAEGRAFILNASKG